MSVWGMALPVAARQAKRQGRIMGRTGGDADGNLVPLAPRDSSLEPGAMARALEGPAPCLCCRVALSRKHGGFCRGSRRVACPAPGYESALPSDSSVDGAPQGQVARATRISF